MFNKIFNKFGIKGISSALVAILFATVSVALVGTTYYFSKGVMEGTIAETFEVIDIFGDRVIVRNTGTQAIEKLTSIVDGKEIENEMETINPGKVGTVKLIGITEGRHELVLISRSMSQRWIWEVKVITATTSTTTSTTSTTTIPINYIEVNGTWFTQSNAINITGWSSNLSSTTYLWNNYTGNLQLMLPFGVGVQTNITLSSNSDVGTYNVSCNSTWNSTLAWKTFTVYNLTCPPESCQNLLEMTQEKFMSKCGNPKYDPVYDINKNGTIDMKDIYQVIFHCGDGDWCEEKLNDKTDPCVSITEYGGIEAYAETEQGLAEVGKPVKWTSRIDVNNPSTVEIRNYKIGLIITEDANNVVIKDPRENVVSEEPSFMVSVVSRESKSYFVEYETPAPYKEESIIKPFVPGRRYQKSIVVKSDFSGHYENVKTYTDIPEELSKNRYSIRLYHIKNGSRIDVTRNPEYDVSFIDSDGNDLIDRIEWTVPKLSEQTFELIAQWISKPICHIDEDVATSGYCEILDSAGNRPNFIGKLLNYTVKMDVTVWKGIDTGDGVYFYHSEDRTTKTAYQGECRYGGSWGCLPTTGTYYIQNTSQVLLDYIEHDGIDQEWLYYEYVGLGRGEDLEADLYVIFDYDPPPKYSNIGTNVTEPEPNEWVLHNVEWTDLSLSGYIFWSNYSVGCQNPTGCNDTWKFLSSTNDWSNETKQMPSNRGYYAWRIYANDSLNQWNDTGIQSITVSNRWLEVNLTNPDPGVYDESYPKKIIQNDTFNVNATLECQTDPPGLSCGSVSSGIRYNNTGNVMTLINTTEGAEPMFVLGEIEEYYDQYVDAYWNFSVANEVTGNPSGVTYNGTHFWIIDRSSSNPKIFRYTADGTYDGWSKDCSAQDTYLEGIGVNATHIFVAGTGNDKIYLYDIETGNYITSFYVSSQTTNPTGVVFNGTYFWVSSSLSGNDKVYRYTADGVYDNWYFDAAWGGELCMPEAVEFNGTNFFVIDNADDMVYAYDLDGNYIYWNFSVTGNVWGLDFSEDELNFYTVDYTDKYVRRYTRNSTIIHANPISLGTLNDGDSKQVNFTVNVTGNPGESYKIDVNFTSDLNLENETKPAIIKIIETEPLSWLNVTLLTPDPSTYNDTNPLEVYQYNAFPINATVECMDAACGNVYGTVKYNASSANPDTAINMTQGATPFYVVKDLLYVDSNDTTYTDWSVYGSEPYLDAVDYPTNYINGTTNNNKMGNFSFENTSLTGSIDEVWLEANLSTYSGTIRIEFYIWNTTGWFYVDKIGSVGAGEWELKRFNVTSYLDTADEVNSAKMFLNTSGVAGYWTAVDMTRLNVTYKEISGNNPDSCGSMSEGDTCQLNWTVNTTGTIDSAYKIGVKFNSSYTSVDDNHTDNATVQISGGNLIVNLTTPDPGVYNDTNPLGVKQNTTFNVNVTITCKDAACGNVYGTVKYNASSANPDTAINMTQGATPFYVVKDLLYVDSNDTTYTDWSVYGSEPYLDAVDYPTNYINVTGNNKKMGNFSFENTSLTGSIDEVWVELNMSTSHALQYIEIYIWNGSWHYVDKTSTMLAWNLRRFDVTSYLDTVEKVNSAKMFLNTSSSFTTLWSAVDMARLNVTYKEISGNNPDSCGSMSEGDTCQLNWTVNVIGAIDDAYKIGVLFNSSYVTIKENHTDNATIKITPPVSVTSVTFNVSDFKYNDPVRCNGTVSSSNNVMYSVYYKVYHIGNESDPEYHDSLSLDACVGTSWSEGKVCNVDIANVQGFKGSWNCSIIANDGIYEENVTGYASEYAVMLNTPPTKPYIADPVNETWFNKYTSSPYPINCTNLTDVKDINPEDQGNIKYTFQFSHYPPSQPGWQTICSDDPDGICEWDWKNEDDDADVFLRCKAKDPDNAVTESDIIQIGLDKTDPECVLTIPNSQILTDPYLLNGTYQDDTSGMSNVTYKYYNDTLKSWETSSAGLGTNSTPDFTWTWDVPDSLEDDINVTLMVTCNDTAGNDVDNVTTDIIVDIINQYPQIWNLKVRDLSDNSIDKVWPKDVVLITVNASDPDPVRNISYVECNFTDVKNGNIELFNLTEADHGHNYTHNESLFIKYYWGPGQGWVNVTVFDTEDKYNKTTTNITIVEGVELWKYNEPINFSTQIPGPEEVQAEYEQGWPFIIQNQGNIPINLSQAGEDYLTGMADPDVKITITNITWNQTDIGSFWSELTNYYKLINETLQSSENQSIYYKMKIPALTPQHYGGVVTIKGGKVTQ